MKNKWYAKYLSVYQVTPDQVSQSTIDTIANQLKKFEVIEPLVTISVIAYNEDKNLWACLWSLSDLKSRYPIEIIGVNNNSIDKTEEIFKKSGIRYFNEQKNGCGFARLCGLNHARGKYHLNIDADTLYPSDYVDVMVSALKEKGVVAASASWGYIPDKDHSRFSLWLYTWARDIFLFVQSIKRPELSVRGLVFAYHTELAQKVGIRTDIIRGEDGSLALGLKKFGKIAFVRDKKAKAMTGYGTLSADGTLFNSFKVRLKRAFKNFLLIFSKSDSYKDEDSNLIKSDKRK
ncbi:MULTISPECIES: glycosyltransferase family 2 protein [unclassified Sphingobacterium]|uniref:glycosyltransferase family 2 protein n=1 Tax=unclassified Sphingobacterium TaxID=2609468 RepID=UPI0025F461DC|nr:MULTISPECIES: glycosyltransferase family 2 protein [unclassified Sphingobacterium]